MLLQKFISSKKSNFLIGMGSAFNINGNYYDLKKYLEDSDHDKKSINYDWQQIGNDLKNVIKELEVDGEKIR